MIGDFDDDLFASPKERPAASNCGYEVKFCSREWYLDDRLADSTNEDKLQVLKFQADNAYWKADYLGALASYHDMLGNGATLPSQMAREVVESIGLCYLKLGKSQQALQWGIRMWQQSKNKDHEMGSLMLLAKVYHQLEQHDREVLAYLEQLQGHPLAAFSWASFGEALAFYWEIPFSEPMTSPRIVQAVDKKPQLLSGLNERAVRCLIGSCFIRVRLIVEMGTKRFATQSHWTYKGVLDKAEHWIQGLQLSEEFKRLATENMSHDIRADASRQEVEEQPEFHDLGKSSTLAADTDTGSHAAMFPTDQAMFYRMWFGWMNCCEA